MKIVDVKARVMRASTPEFLIGGGIPFHLDLSSTIVEVHTDAGIVGRGETTLARGQDREETMARAIVNNFKPLIVDKDPRQISLIWEELWMYVKLIGWAGP